MKKLPEKSESAKGIPIIPEQDGNLAVKLEPGVEYRWFPIPETFWCIINGSRHGNVPDICPSCGQTLKEGGD